MKARFDKLRLSLVAILLGFLLGAVIVLATGESPMDMVNAMFRGFTGINLAAGTFNPRLVGEFILQSLPILLTGLSVGFAFRTGLFNIGAEGQVMMGSIAATAAALLVQAPRAIHLPVVLLSAMAAGAVWGAIPGFLKARFNIHEVVVTIMLNHTAFHLNNYAVLSIFGSVDRIKTEPFAETALLHSPFLESITNGSRLHWGFVPVILAILVYWFVINKTTFGYSLRATGFNREAARCAGMKVERNMVLSMMIAGAFAALAGAIMTVGTFSFGRALPAAEGYGFDGIAVALVGGNEAVGILLAGLLFGMLKAAQPLMQSAGIPMEIAGIIQASIVLFVAMKYGIEGIFRRAARKAKGAAP
ncbi:MAG TPA: ABC transporter permease [Magnetospirillaceae bacterium]|nr:ABC transporter permease [Magnetospirillaceae bacterium]